MPATINPQNDPSGAQKLLKLREVNHNYDYPEGLNLKPGSELHDKIVREITERARESKNALSTLRKPWPQMEAKLKGYVRPEYYRQIEDTKRDTRKKVVPEIVMPVTFATMETLLTYMVTAFTRSPVFRYEGVGPEDIPGGMLMQLVIGQHVHRNAIALNLHTQWRDCFAYGFGAVHPYWRRKWGYKTIVQERGMFSEIVSSIFGGEARNKVSAWSLIHEGNALKNIDPYNYYPDPGVPIDQPQDGEYNGWGERTTRIDLLKRESDDEDIIFNAKYLAHIDGRSSHVSYSEQRDDKPSDNLSSKTRPVDVIWMGVDLIPKEWGLGKGEYPEKWVFGVAADSLVIAAAPQGLDHEEFSTAVAAPDYDGHTFAPLARLESISSIQHLIDFLYSSHIENIRKVINDMFVVDPYMVNIYDLQDPEPGKLIRMRKGNWGRASIDAAIKQLNVQDVTQNHVQESMLLRDFAFESAGATDAVRGVMQNRGPRISAQQASQATRSSLSRIEKIATIIGLQSMQPIGRHFASNAQQLMEEESWVEASGEMLERLRADYPHHFDNENSTRVKVGPLDILVDYDLKVADGSVPGGENAQTWVQLFQFASQTNNQELLQRLDFVKLFKHIARQMDARNPEEFIKALPASPTVMEDETVEEQARQGNLVPMGDGV